MELIEDSSSIKVTCDGYIFLLKKTISYTLISIRNSSDTDNHAAISHQFFSGSKIYRLGYDENRVSTVLVNTRTYIHLRVVGKPDYTWPGTEYLANADLQIDFHIYSDRICVELRLKASGTLISDSNTCGFSALMSGTNEGNIYGTTSESIESNQWKYRNNENYIGCISDECNIFGVVLRQSVPDGSTTTFVQQNWNTGECWWNWWGGNIVAGTAKMALMLIIDTPDRAAGSKLYTPEDRIAIGNQYKDSILSLSSGSAVTSTALTGCTAIGSSGFGSNGAWHLEMT